MAHVAKHTVKIDETTYAPGETIPALKDKQQRERLARLGAIAAPDEKQDEE